MARDKGLEELLKDHLASVSGLTQKAMFGGWAWLVHGNLLCAARVGSMLVRLGKEHETWALKIPGISPMMMRERRMPGWVRATPEVYGDDSLREKLVNAAPRVQSLPSEKVGLVPYLRLSVNRPEVWTLLG